MNPNLTINIHQSSFLPSFSNIPTNLSLNLSKLQFFKQYEVPLNDISTELTKNSPSIPKVFLNDQRDYTERQMIIDKMQTTLWKLGSSKDVLFNSIYLMDIIIENHTKESKAIIRLEEIAMGSLFLSIKFLQFCDSIPPLRTIQTVFDPNYFYSKSQLKLIEIFCLKHTNYNLSLCNPFTSLEFIILRGIIFPSDCLKEPLKIVQLKLVTYSREILKKVIKKSNEYIKYNQIHLALSIICYSREKKQLAKWNEGFELLYEINLDKLHKTLDFLNRALTEKRASITTSTSTLTSTSARINGYYHIERKNKTKSHIQVKASSSIKDIRQTTQYQNSTIESYRKKSQRSTSASLDETTLIKQIHMKTQQRKQNLCSISYRKNNTTNRKSYNNNSSLLNELNSKCHQLRNNESYRKEYTETISIKENPIRKSMANSSINNSSMILNQTNQIQPPYKKLSLVLDKTKQLRMMTSRLQSKKPNLNKLLFQIECRRKINSSKEKSIKTTMTKFLMKPKEPDHSLKKIQEALKTAQTQRKIKKRLTSSLTLINIPKVKQETNKEKLSNRKNCNERCKFE